MAATRRGDDVLETRNVKPYAEAVSPGELEVGTVYCAVQFSDDDTLIPTVEPLVFIGRDLGPSDVGQLYFQDAESYRRGVRYGDKVADPDVVYYRQSEGELGHIFGSERALDVLMSCAMRRRSRGTGLHDAEGLRAPGRTNV